MQDKLIIDTDIGTDGDDALALAYALASGVDIALITTVHGNTQVRAKVAQHLIHLMGYTIPVIAGEQKPIKQSQIFWTGIEGYGVPAMPDLPDHGVESIIQCVNEFKNNMSIVAIGPLTNIALALQKDPGLEKRINHLYIMGNAVLRPTEFILNYRAHNFKVDPEAADIVLASKVPMTLVTTSVAKHSALSKSELNQLHNGGAASRYLASSALYWMEFANFQEAFLYDPLVVHHFLDSDITQKQYYGDIVITTAMNKEFKPLVLKTLKELQ